MWPCEAQLMDHLMSHKTEQSPELTSSAMLALSSEDVSEAVRYSSKKSNVPASQKVAFLLSRGCHYFFIVKPPPTFFFSSVAVGESK